MNTRLFGVGIAAAAALALQPFRLFVVDGISMTPTFASGQILLANTRPRALTRGDVVVFRHQGETMVKRVAYLPGDSLERFWFVGEWKLPFTGKMRETMERLKLPSRRDTIPADCVFVLADNREGSIDSRTFGPIPKKEIVAVVPNASRAGEWTIVGGQLGKAAMAQL